MTEMHVPTQNENALTFALSSTMAPFYEKETACAAKFQEILADHDIVMMVMKVNGTEFTTDGNM